MNGKCKRGIASFLVVALIAMLCFGCGDDEDKEEAVTIVIGEITDLTGPASPGVIPLHYLTEDLLRYYNEEGLIPGVKLRLVTYDAAYNPAKDVPGYDWCRGRGAEVISAVMPFTATTLKPFAERDKVVLVNLSTDTAVVEPPGWAFSLTLLHEDLLRTMLKWISEEHWDYEAEGRPPKVGYCDWRLGTTIELERLMREYCQAQPHKFEYIDGLHVPVGTMSFGPEADKLKECDYVWADSMAGAYFIRDFSARGYEATFIGEQGSAAFQGFDVDLCGWEALDGYLITFANRNWNEPYPVVDLAEELLYRYHPHEAEDIIYSGISYVGSLAPMMAFCELLGKAIEEVGAENFDGQAFYDAALDFEVQLEGWPRWYFTETVRYLIHDVAIYEWSAEAEDIVRISDWLPLVLE